MHVRTACRLLKRFPRYDQKIFMNVVTGDESWIHYFDPHRFISNRVWLTKNARRPCIAIRITRTTSTKKGYVCHIFTTMGLAIQVLIPKDKSMNARFHKKQFKKACQILPKTSIEDGYLCYVFVTRQRLKSQGGKCDIIFERAEWLFSRSSTLFSWYSPLWLFFSSLVWRKIVLAENITPT